MLWVPFLLTLVAVACDLRSREIPNRIPASILVSACVAWAAGWLDITGAALVGGVALGLALSGVIYWLGGWGGGDVKLLAALGAWLGPTALLSTCFWMAIVGAVLSCVSLARGRRDLAYAPAIAGGLLIYLLWPETLRQLVAA
jgi:prepilin peptidase CpaA